MSIKSRQVAGVTTLVVFIVAVLSAFHLATLARLSLAESQSRGDLLLHAIFQRAREVAPRAANRAIPTPARRCSDGGIRSLLESSMGFAGNVTYAAIVNREGIAVAHSLKDQEGQHMTDQEDLASVLKQGSLQLLRAVYSDRTFEIREPLLLGDQDFGSIRIGVSTLLVKHELREALRTALQSVLLALLISTRRGDAARAVDAAPDSRDPERPHASRTRRAGRPPRAAGRGGVQGSGHLLRGRQRAAVRGRARRR